MQSLFARGHVMVDCKFMYVYCTVTALGGVSTPLSFALAARTRNTVVEFFRVCSNVRITSELKCLL